MFLYWDVIGFKFIIYDITEWLGERMWESGGTPEKPQRFYLIS